MCISINRNSTLAFPWWKSALTLVGGIGSIRGGIFGIFAVSSPLLLLWWTCAHLNDDVTSTAPYLRQGDWNVIQKVLIPSRPSRFIRFNWQHSPPNPTLPSKAKDEKTFFEFWTRACRWWLCQCTGMSRFFSVYGWIIKFWWCERVRWQQRGMKSMQIKHNAEWRERTAALRPMMMNHRLGNFALLRRHETLHHFRLMWNRVTIPGSTSIKKWGKEWHEREAKRSF